MNGLDVESSDDGVDSAKDAESLSGSGSDSLVGVRLRTEYGEGTVEEMRVYEGAQFCVLRLRSFGTACIPYGDVVSMLRKERRWHGPACKDHTLSGARVPNMTGRIRMYNPSKGWGFISCEGFSGDIFLHQRNIADSSLAGMRYIGHFNDLSRGVRSSDHIVKFDLDLHQRNRPQALLVKFADEALYCRDEETNPGDCEPPREDITGTAAMRESTTGQAEPEISKDGDEDVIQEIQAAVIVPANGVLEPGLQTWKTAEANETVPTLGPSADTTADTEKSRRCLRMRGLPFTATSADISMFFEGFGVRPEDVTLWLKPTGGSSGECSVEFRREELALKALKERNLQHMGHRYIELFQGGALPENTPQRAAIYKPFHGDGATSEDAYYKPYVSIAQSLSSTAAEGLTPTGFSEYHSYSHYNHSDGSVGDLYSKYNVGSADLAVPASHSGGVGPAAVPTTHAAGYDQCGWGTGNSAVEAAQAAHAQRVAAEAYAQAFQEAYAKAFQEAAAAQAFPPAATDQYDGQQATTQAYAASMAEQYDGQQAAEQDYTEALTGEYEQYQQYQDYQNHGELQ